MTRRSPKTICLFALALASATVFAVDGDAASAQCATCVAPTVAYSPVVTPATTVVQPTVVETGWYPGKLLGRLFGGCRTAPTYTAAYVPTTYAASYAPAAYTASYTPAPYIAAYAPTATPVMQTSYMPVTTTPAPVITNYAPTTVYRPVEVAPVVQSAVIQAAPACCPTDPCGACAACTTTVTQAAYVPGTTVSAPGCATCAPATTSSGPTYATPPATSGAAASTGGQATPPPSLPSDYAAPSTSQYAPGQGSTTNGAAGAQNNESAGGVAPSPLPDEGEDGATTPGTNGAEATEPTTYWNFEAPPLIGPQNNDRTAHRPTVDIHNAVYRPAAGGANVSATSASTTVAKPVSNAGGWYSVSERD